ncbi:hypothetical protein LOT_1432 [Lentilactobacillus otakiensis DSM 19908 = JCM 15040]|uniref:Uncharacterized protein n=1 Tax=Lentilactobacillus otakiensis DSM 19908 = JCM 15040 TaxID=1423780 RepID=S4NDD1_9LACO|nr:hypothetical protein LOT_1432 [Lentilactobacillus otakiensis DSM 19908 = JCM 15040]
MQSVSDFQNNNQNIYFTIDLLDHLEDMGKIILNNFILNR